MWQSWHFQYNNSLKVQQRGTWVLTNKTVLCGRDQPDQLQPHDNTELLAEK